MAGSTLFGGFLFFRYLFQLSSSVVQLQVLLPLARVDLVISTLG